MGGGAVDDEAPRTRDDIGQADAAPDGLRLWITLPPGPALSGTLVRDWVRPNFVQPRS